MLEGLLQSRAYIWKTRSRDLRCSVSISNSFMEKRKIRKTELLFLRCKEGREAVLGKDHLDTLEAAHCHAQLFYEDSRVAAYYLMRDLVTRSRNALGRNHQGMRVVGAREGPSRNRSLEDEKIGKLSPIHS